MLLLRLLLSGFFSSTIRSGFLRLGRLVLVKTVWVFVFHAAPVDIVEFGKHEMRHKAFLDRRVAAGGVEAGRSDAAVFSQQFFRQR